MPLALPEQFKKDIQANDTSIVPVVSIFTGTAYKYISTNQIEIKTYPALIPVVCKPLLLNVPSLKESIDLETRKYKINSVS